MHELGKDNTKADSLSRNPVLPVHGDDVDKESQVARVCGDSGLQISKVVETTLTTAMIEEQKKEGYYMITR